MAVASVPAPGLPAASHDPMLQRIFASLLHPPLRDRRFWATQALVFLIAAAHDSIEVSGLMPSLRMAYFLPISMFFIPVVYAALYFGLRGSLATAFWCTVISAPNFMLFHHGSSQIGVMSQMLILDAIAVFVGNRVDEEMTARADAVRAWQALHASEARYRGLFESSSEAVVVVDYDGIVVDHNAAASRLFGRGVKQLLGIEIGSLLTKEAVVRTEGETDTADGVPIVAEGGRRAWVVPVSSPLEDPTGFRQIVLRDVTEQKRRETGLQTYAAEVVKGQEAERRRIAQELHDDTVQSLVLLWRTLDEFASKSTNEPVPRDRLLHARDTAGTIAESVRNYARGLRPPALDDLGLTPAIRRLVSELSARSGVAAKLKVHGIDRRLPPEIELTLFRIAQEALRNAERHSEAESVQVTLDYGDTATVLTVCDDGVGFSPAPPHELTTGRRLGLTGMRERARSAGGSLSIESGEEAGTKVIAKIPQRPAATMS